MNELGEFRSARTLARRRVRRSQAIGCVCLGVALSLHGFAVAQNDDFIRGDVNADGQVSLTDVNSLYVFDLSALNFPCEDAADVNDDGSIAVHLSAAPPPSDVVALLDWLFGVSEVDAPVLPAPFPIAGADPPDAGGVNDSLTCVTGFLGGPAPANPSYVFDWQFDPIDEIDGAQILMHGQSLDLYLVVDTAAGVDGFSEVVQINTDVFQVNSVDLVGTVFPVATRAAFEASPLFQVNQTPSLDAGFDLLQVGAVFRETNGTPISFPATLNPLVGARLLHIAVQVKPSAPSGLRTVLRPFTGTYAGGFSQTVGGIRGAFIDIDDMIIPERNLPTNKTALTDPDGILFIRGDSNGDGDVDVSDPIFTLISLFGGGPSLTSLELLPYDANDDDSVNIADPCYTLNFLFNSGTPPLSPFPGCGLDPMPSMLKAASYRACSP